MSSRRSDQAYDRPHQQQPNGGTECDPEIVDCLKCKAAGIQAQANYNAGHLPELDTGRTNYDKARSDYRDARHGVALDVQDMRHQIKHLTERIKCLIKQEHVARCLDEAYEKIGEQLERCGTTQGCCLDDNCEFDDEAADLSDDELAARIADYQHRTDSAKDCFNNLIQEPGKLTTHVAALKTEVGGITTDLAGDPAKTDLKDLYARTLVAHRHLHEIWSGFEHTTDFVECLCRALMCWSQGCAANTVLTGEQAVRTCHKEAREARCDYLKKNTAKEILAAYDKICTHDHHDDSEDDEESSTD